MIGESNARGVGWGPPYPVAEIDDGSIKKVGRRPGLVVSTTIVGSLDIVTNVTIDFQIEGRLMLQSLER